MSSLLIFAVATYFLVKSADVFVENIEKLGIAWRLPHFITGVLLVAIGTSLPEFFTSITAVLRSETDMLAGNVLGTVIANIFLGLGLVSVLAGKNIKFDQNIFKVHFPIFVLAISIVAITMLDRRITATEGVFFLGIGAAYLWFLLADGGRQPFFQTVKFSWKFPIFAMIGLAGLTISSNFVIDSIIDLAKIFGFEKTTLAATLIAVGTSLPEMIVVFTMIRRKNFDMAVGNILGSNIFDILLIFGAGSIIAPLAISNLTFTLILPFMIATLFVYWAISIDREITRQEGLAMVFLYALFLGKIFEVI